MMLAWAAVATALLVVLVVLLRRAQGQLTAARGSYVRLEARFRNVLDAEAERARIAREAEALRAEMTREKATHVASLEADRMRTAADLEAIRASHSKLVEELQAQQASLNGELSSLQGRHLSLSREVSALDEEAHLQSFGFYKKHFDFATSERYDSAILDVERRQKALVKNGEAAICTTTYTLEGSEAKGKQFVKRILTLMLRAFNGECDAAIAKVKYNNVDVMEARIRKACEAINKLTIPHHCYITDTYLKLRLEELFLTHEQHERLQEEKEEQRRIREQIREEEQAQRELERAKLDAEKEERRYEAALVKARADVERLQGEKQAAMLAKIAEMEAALADAHAQKERAISQAQLTRSGHVYVISNIGSFGERVFKIGMTRRLDPQERIKELGDASVPFAFDVHAVIYSEDAPGLESKLHRAFADRRINLVNERKEFFEVDIDEVVRAVRENHGDVLITKAAEAAEYRKTVALLKERGVARSGWGSYDRRTAPRDPEAVVA